MKMHFKQLAGLVAIVLPLASIAQEPVAGWSFDKVENRTAIETVSGKTDTIEGNFEVVRGVAGNGLALDGFTACVRGTGTPPAGDMKEFTIEAWIALGQYPWNWCPVLTTESNEVKGFRLMVGPLGQASLECAIGEQWVCCTSERDALPLRKWIHLAGVYRSESEMALYIDGEPVSVMRINGSFTSTRSPFLLGMVAAPEKPSDIHRTWGTVAAYFGLDGILDEVSLFNAAKTAEQVKKDYASVMPPDPGIAPRHLPIVDSKTNRFGAYYTKLKYYPSWDNLWPVDQDPDIVVTFPDSPVKYVFWRGTRYGPAWVTENQNWMTDQSVEAWDTGDNDSEGCFEHMQDRHCRFSHVRVIENTDARVVVHWRYAPVSSHDNTWRVDPKTGWECWIDEYYYIYPDGTAIRKVSWKKGSLGLPRQFQETLALLSPGQAISDLLEKDYATAADYDGKTQLASFVENPNVAPYGPFDWSKTYDYTIQQYNFKAQNKPFICFEPGNQMYIRYERLSGYNQAGGCNHFPVGQARCDGRTTRTSDRPSHCSSFPISDPVIHESGDREYWNALYGMNTMKIADLVRFGRSWAYAPDLTIKGKHYQSDGYITAERCYRIVNMGSKPETVELTIKGSKDSPVCHPAILVKSWNGENARVLVDGKSLKGSRTGINHELEGNDLVVYLPVDRDGEVNVRIIPVK